ncbi:MAG: hypothetical protein JSR64_09780 [Nitrospira sp.]|nr:hypothetical protein [Nitrospira sp.]MBS0194360.1 hypothetical protein [Pseudomonadota bacterium]
MSDTNNNRPFNVYSVREYEIEGDKRSEWIRVGVAFPNRDGKGFNVQLTALPLDGKLVIREPKAGEE